MPDELAPRPQDAGFDAALSAEPSETPIPEGYRSLIDPEAWLSDFTPDQRRVIAEREQRAKTNREEQLERVTREMDQRIQQALANHTGSNGNGTPGSTQGNGKAGQKTWSDMPDSEFFDLYDQALTAQEAAQRDPDNEEAAARAARLSPKLMREFAREDARRQAAALVDESNSRRDAVSQEEKLQNSTKSKILKEFGGQDGEAILDRNHPMFVAAERHWKHLLEMNGGQDGPGLVYAAYRDAHRELSGGNRDQPGGIARRDREMNDVVQRQSARTHRISSLRRKGDEIGAHNEALDAFLNEEALPEPYVPPHIQRMRPGQ